MRNKKLDSYFSVLPETSNILVSVSYSCDQGGFDFRTFTAITCKASGYLDTRMRELCKRVKRTGLCGKCCSFEPFKIKTEDGRIIFYSESVFPCRDVKAFAAIEVELTNDFLLKKGI